MGVLRSLTQWSAGDGPATATLREGYRVRADALGGGILRLMVLPEAGLRTDRTWLIAPEGDVPWEGRARDAVEGFARDPLRVRDGAARADGFRVSLDANTPLAIRVERDGRPLLQDRPRHAWRTTAAGEMVHYSLLGEGARHYGLGDAAGPLDRTGRRLRCLPTDALGYDAQRSDPLYKHAPFVLCDGPQGAFGLLYDTMAEATFDLGAEHSNYFPHYRHVSVRERGIVLYVLDGPTVADVVRRLYRLTGSRPVPPRWAMGFAFTSMHHADADDAQATILSFARQARARDVPISAIHFGSGYSAGADGLRYVFQWNESRFPDRRNLFAELSGMGLRTVANCKPVLLTGHPDFPAAAQGGWFVTRADGTPAVEAFWGGEGASLDMTNADARTFWYGGVADAVLGQGFDAVWNDNNEGELWDETATLAGEDADGGGARLPAVDCRPVHALLMTRTSRAAQRAHRPGERPYVISRAGPIGIARYGETWSGDNVTSWHTLKWNLRQGLSMGLSGFPLVGHDIGGFVGPPPDAELLIRWFQMMALHPRCVMNSWKADHGNVPNLPWMHEEALPAIRAALRLRYRLLPHLYSCVLDACREGLPVIAPPFLHYPHHGGHEDDAFLLGRDVLVVPVVAEGARHVRVRLPAGADWVDTATGTLHRGGETVTLDAPLDRLPILVRAGSALLEAAAWSEHAPHDAQALRLTIHAPEEGSARGLLRWDDGLTDRPAEEAARLRWSLDPARTTIAWDWEGDAGPVPPVTVAVRDPQARDWSIERR